MDDVHADAAPIHHARTSRGDGPAAAPAPSFVRPDACGAGDVGGDDRAAADGRDRDHDADGRDHAADGRDVREINAEAQAVITETLAAIRRQAGD